MDSFSVIVSVALVGALAWVVRRMARRGAARSRNVPEQFFGATGDETLMAESRADTPQRPR
jgi:hypothetical protein